jgi:hypothetical protein
MLSNIIVRPTKQIYSLTKQIYVTTKVIDASTKHIVVVLGNICSKQTSSLYT